MSHLELFLEMMVAERGASVNTILAYRRDLKDFSGFMKMRGKNPEKASEKDINNYIVSIDNSGMSPKTQSRRLSSLREFFRFLFSENVRKDNPTDNLASPKINRSLPKYLSEEEIAQILSVTRNLKHDTAIKALAMMEILYASGLRVSELSALPLSSVNQGHQAITVTGKGQKERMVPLNPNALTAIAEWLRVRENHLKRERGSKWLFPSRSKSGHITRDGCFKILKELAVMAGINPERVSPHVIRHSFASHLIAHDADLRSVQKMLGHADIATTEIYTHVLDDRLNALVKNKHPLASLKISSFKHK